MDNNNRNQNKMLIDATHPEETRVVVIRNGRVEEFDFESASKKPLRGNIYLAKVTRVEPSLQAAFVEYGGNRHGFLPFAEIHPDYYQIPLADRQALLDEEMAELEADREADERRDRGRGGRQRGHNQDHEPANGDGEQPPMPLEAGAEPPAVDEPSAKTAPQDMAESTGLAPDIVHTEAAPAEAHGADVPEREAAPVDHIEEIPVTADEPEIITGAGAEADTGGAFEEGEERPLRQRRRHYKIQEVIKRRQIMLVQVVKEERGTKGAALTTYLSLAGRYTVLMPNTAAGGGISRKITQPQDRKRLKDIARELDVPEGMGLIIRTAGAARSTQEIRRDYEYELRLWENIREVTLASTAPSLVYEEGDLIKRSIRDLYSKDIDEIVVAGEPAFREAQEFMRMLMPSHVKNVTHHDSPQPLFARYPAVERQMNAMFSPHVPLKSGGYLVINQTEALVAIDINSGRSTREFSIEDTATNTNLEAADEIARQLRLRDLAGLIVIDFIDMEEKRNIRKVEHRMKDALRHDRARIQVGRISHFGLLEMSRQRMRTGVLEGSTSKCPHCEGTGSVRSVESVCLAVLRGLEDHLMRDARTSVTVQTTAEVALYILNHKRAYIIDLEQRYGIAIHVSASDKVQGANFQIERSAAPPPARSQPQRAPVNMNSGFDGSAPEEEFDDAAAHTAHDDSSGMDTLPELGEAGPAPRQFEDRRDRPQFNGEDGPDNARRRRRRRRGRRGRDEGDRGDRTEGTAFARDGQPSADTLDEGMDEQPPMPDAPFPQAQPAAYVEHDPHPVAPDDDQPELVNGDGDDRVAAGPAISEGDRRGSRRRGRRGGRSRRDRAEAAPTPELAAAPNGTDEDVETRVETIIVHEATEPAPMAEPVAAVPAPKPAPIEAPVVEVAPEPPKPAPLTEPLITSDAPARPAKSGWWRRGTA
jgi:ribonuclease E